MPTRSAASTCWAATTASTTTSPRSARRASRGYVYADANNNGIDGLGRAADRRRASLLCWTATATRPARRRPPTPTAIITSTVCCPATTAWRNRSPPVISTGSTPRAPPAARPTTRATRSPARYLTPGPRPRITTSGNCSPASLSRLRLRRRQQQWHAGRGRVRDRRRATRSAGQRGQSDRHQRRPPTPTGYYQFDGLLPGVYGVAESQPARLSRRAGRGGHGRRSGPQPGRLDHRRQPRPGDQRPGLRLRRNPAGEPGRQGLRTMPTTTASTSRETHPWPE